MSAAVVTPMSTSVFIPIGPLLMPNVHRFVLRTIIAAVLTVACTKSGTSQIQESETDLWGQVPTKKTSLTNLAPVLLPVNYKSNSWVTIGNFSQYISVKEDSGQAARTLQSGQPLRGTGVFGRVGYAPEETNTITRDASFALFAHGLADRRKEDSLVDSARCMICR
jgi:hypothetical protein